MVREVAVHKAPTDPRVSVSKDAAFWLALLLALLLLPPLPPSSRGGNNNSPGALLLPASSCGTSGSLLTPSKGTSPRTK